MRRALALLPLVLTLVACEADAPDGPDGAPEIVELHESVDHQPNLEPIRGDTGLLAQPVGELPAHFAFVDENGEERTFAELRGRFVVVDFIFTECSGPCPPMSEAMGQLQARIKDVDDVVIRSISVDPRNDTPEVLADYGKAVGAEPGTWGFARLPIGFVNELTREEFLVGDGGTPLAHTTKFLLIDPEGRCRAHYTPLADPAWIDKLVADVERLRAEHPQ